MPKTNWSDIGAVRVRFFAGRTDHYDTLVDAVRRVGWYEIDKLDTRYYGSDLAEWERVASFWLTRNKIIFLDELGLVIPLDIVRRVAMEQGLHTVPNFWGRWRPRYRRGHPWAYEFRDGPVPGIRCSRASRRGMAMRRMRTTQEIAEATWMFYDDDALDYGIKDRPCRRKLPTWWDDRPISNQDARNWKQYRLTQWKSR